MDWPELPYAAWRETAATLQLWTQIVGQGPAGADPLANHGWQVPLYVSRAGSGPRRFRSARRSSRSSSTSSTIASSLERSRGASGRLPLEPQTVADFYAAMFDLCTSSGSRSTINECRAKCPIRSASRRIASTRAYDPAAAHRFWRALVQADRVFKLFRTGFLGRSARSISSGVVSISR